MAPKLIFTITPGRSGTAYLARLLGAIPGVSAYHEPEPNFARVMRAAQSDPQIAHDFLVRHKMPALAACSGMVYAETSHLTGKGLVEPMLELGLCPALILLTRPAREVAWSLLLRQTIPARTPAGLIYLLSPDDPKVMKMEKWRSASHYQLCFWYALEMERRQRHYAELAAERGLTAVEISADGLNEWACFARMATALDLTIDEQVQAAHGDISAVRHNANVQTAPLPPWLETEERGVYLAVGQTSP